jgi:hypothetical protein
MLMAFEPLETLEDLLPRNISLSILIVRSFVISLNKVPVPNFTSFYDCRVKFTLVKASLDLELLRLTALNGQKAGRGEGFVEPRSDVVGPNLGSFYGHSQGEDQHRIATGRCS